MKRVLLFIGLIFLLISCGKEDWLTNISPEINFFAVGDEEVGEEADLRREFFDRTGVYVVFNDTLGTREKETVGGDKVLHYEVIRWEWNMLTGSVADSFVCYPYDELEEKKLALRFIEEEVLTSVPDLFYPYSILILDRFVWFKDYYGIYFEAPVDLPAYAAMQVTALACGNLSSLSENEKEKLKNEMISEMICSKISKITDEDLAGFYSYSEDYYDVYSFNVPSPIQSVGFLDTYYYTWGVTFNSRNYDLLAYVEEVFELSESEFRDTYSDYPVVLQKMEELVRVLNQYGVKVYE